MIKEVASYGVENLKTIELLTRGLWCQLAHLFGAYVEETHLSSTKFPKSTAKLHEPFMTNELDMLVDWQYKVLEWYRNYAHNNKQSNP